MCWTAMAMPDAQELDMALPAETIVYLRDLACKLDAASGNKRQLVEDAAEFLGWSAQTVYRQLQRAVGWSSGRKCRSDKGTTSVPQTALMDMAAAQRELVRDNGKQALFTTTARGILESSGRAFGVSNSQINRLMRTRKLNVAAQKVAAPVQRMRALYPNHVHEVDPSLCLIYYMRGRQHIIRDREYYKNKLDKIAKLQLRVYRYVLYDRASGVIIPWYVEAAGETQHDLFNFLMYAWGRQEGKLFHGVPEVMLWDKGSAMQSGAIKNLLRHLGVQAIDHEAGNARAKGGVENGNNIVETQFESRLRFEPVESVAQLNAAALAWAQAYNANRIPGQDTRLQRAGLAAPMARYDLWQRITAAQLRELPAVEVCRALMAGKLEQRKVGGDMCIQFKHPQAERSRSYCLRGMDGINPGDTVTVRALVYGDCEVQIEVPRYDGEALIYRAVPETEYDAYGQPLAAAVIGQEFKSHADTEAQTAGKAMDKVAYPDAPDAKAARNKKAVPFAGEIQAHSILQDVPMPTFLPRQGTEIEAPAHVRPAAPLMVDSVSAMLRISREMGRNLTPEENQFLAARMGKDGIAEDQLQALIAQFKQPTPEPAQIRAAGGLRAVGGAY